MLVFTQVYTCNKIHRTAQKMSVLLYVKFLNKIINLNNKAKAELYKKTRD